MEKKQAAVEMLIKHWVYQEEKEMKRLLTVFNGRKETAPSIHPGTHRGVMFFTVGQMNFKSR